MFSCYVHNWSHAFNQCPLCPSRVVTTSSDSTEPLELGDPDIIPRWAHTQSELTKLRKRVEVLEKALEKYALPQTRLTKKHEEEQWRLEPGFHDPQTAVEALKESAKIAAADE